MRFAGRGFGRAFGVAFGRGFDLGFGFGLDAARFLATGRAGRRGLAFVAEVRCDFLVGAAFLFLWVGFDAGLAAAAGCGTGAGAGLGSGILAVAVVGGAAGRRSGGSVWI